MARHEWTSFEDRIIADHYPDGGATLCMSFLTDRTYEAIRKRASLLRVKRAVDSVWIRPIHERKIDSAFMALRSDFEMPNMGMFLPNLGMQVAA